MHHPPHPHPLHRRLGVVAVAVTLTLAAAGCQSPGQGPHAETRSAGSEIASPSDQAPSPMLLVASARMLAGQGKDGKSRFILERVVDRHPQYAPTYNELASLHLRHGRIEQAVTVLSKGLDHAPDDPVLMNNLGLCRLMQDRPEEAITHFRRALTRLPENERYKANLGAALGLAGRYDEAMNQLRQVMPEGDAHYNLAILNEAQNDQQRAEKEYRRARELGATASAADELPALPAPDDTTDR